MYIGGFVPDIILPLTLYATDIHWGTNPFKPHEDFLSLQPMFLLTPKRLMF